MLRRMLTYHDQDQSKVGDIFSIQPKCCDRGATRRGDSEQFAEVTIPGEMFWPVIRPRIKERRILQRNGVDSGSLVVFEIVATLTGECQILLDAMATGIERDDVLN